MPLIGACCELSWCEPIEALVRSIGVVVDPPFFDDPSRLAEVREHVLVEALVPQAAVEALPQSHSASQNGETASLFGFEVGVFFNCVNFDAVALIEFQGYQPRIEATGTDSPGDFVR